MTTTTTDDRLVEIEVKLSYHDQSIADLSAVLIEKEKRIAALEDSVARLEKALRIVAARTPEKTGEILGAHPEDDPVPRSG